MHGCLPYRRCWDAAALHGVVWRCPLACCMPGNGWKKKAEPTLLAWKAPVGEIKGYCDRGE